MRMRMRFGVAVMAALALGAGCSTAETAHTDDRHSQGDPLAYLGMLEGSAARTGPVEDDLEDLLPLQEAPEGVDVLGREVTLLATVEDIEAVFALETTDSVADDAPWDPVPIDLEGADGLDQVVYRSTFTVQRPVAWTKMPTGGFYNEPDISRGDYAKMIPKPGDEVCVVHTILSNMATPEEVQAVIGETAWWNLWSVAVESEFRAHLDDERIEGLIQDGCLSFDSALRPDTARGTVTVYGGDAHGVEVDSFQGEKLKGLGASEDEWITEVSQRHNREVACERSGGEAARCE
jgi:hypothetical protein